MTASLPSRGAWIEMSRSSVAVCALSSRSPRGERGLKSIVGGSADIADRRSPRGERGLKSPLVKGFCKKSLSLPSRGAWIEIYSIFGRALGHFVAPLAGSVD